MRDDDRRLSVARTLVWFAVFAVAYITTWVVAGLLLGDSVETTLTGPLIGIGLALVIVVWWRHIRGQRG